MLTMLPMFVSHFDFLTPGHAHQAFSTRCQCDKQQPALLMACGFIQLGHRVFDFLYSRVDLIHQPTEINATLLGAF